MKGMIIIKLLNLHQINYILQLLLIHGKNRDKNNDLILDLSFDNDIYSNNNFDFKSGDYIINFPKICNADFNKEEVFVDKSPNDNKLLIHFPYHQYSNNIYIYYY